MKKKIIGLFLCMLMLTTIPLAAGINVENDPEEESTRIGSTFLRGIITKPRLIKGGHYVTFRAINVHYHTHYPGATQEGVIRLFRKITLPNNFLGFLGNHYVFAFFDGKLDI